MDSNLPLEELVASVDFGAMFDEADARKQVNLWLKEQAGEKYLILQKRTRYKFGREIIRLIEMCVEKAFAADPQNKSA